MAHRASWRGLVRRDFVFAFKTRQRFAARRGRASEFRGLQPHYPSRGTIGSIHHQLNHLGCRAGMPQPQSLSALPPRPSRRLPSCRRKQFHAALLLVAAEVLDQLVLEVLGFTRRDGGGVLDGLIVVVLRIE